VALNQAYFLIFIFTSGQVAPLSFLPAPLQSIAWYLPFRWMLAFPVSLLTEFLSPREIMLGLLSQTLWLIVILTLLSKTWTAGLKRYAAVGL